MTADRATIAIDLRSDTVTRPTDAMRRAMAAAVVGDDSYRDDPTVADLEARAAAELGMAAGLFLPTGTMGNLCAVMAQTQRGDEVILEADSHIHSLEQGGLAVLAGLSSRALPGVRGRIALGDLEAAFDSVGPASSRSALLCLETSHNTSGGAVPPLDYLEQASGLARASGAAVHIDGARLFNAAVALGRPAREIARHADTVTFCLSKGLGAPAGAVLCGPSAVIERARTRRKMLGGSMRQSGVLAAAGLIAMESIGPRLTADHRRARRLAEGLASIDARLCTPSDIETNIVRIELGHTAAMAPDWCDALQRRGVLCRPWSRATLRFVTHGDLTDQAIEATLAAFGEVYERLGRPLSTGSSHAAAGPRARDRTTAP